VLTSHRVCYWDWSIFEVTKAFRESDRASKSLSTDLTKADIGDSVMNVFGDPTPGPRHFENFDSSQFPWRETVDSFEHVASKDSYEMSMQLSREGLVCGPSSGEALIGLFQYLRNKRDLGTLNELEDSVTGETSCVFICCDLPYQYIDGYFQKLGEDKFPPIHNEVNYCDFF
jgi:cysteine synthase